MLEQSALQAAGVMLPATLPQGINSDYIGLTG